MALQRGRVDDGLAMIQQGVDLVPFNVDYRVILEYAFYHLRRFDESLAQGHEARKLDPNRPWYRSGLEIDSGNGRRHATVTEARQADRALPE